MRFYLIAGVILLGATSYFIVIQQEPSFQEAPAMSSLVQLQRENVLPTGPFEENEELEHDVFDVPPMDEMMLEQAMSDMDMGDMDMSQSDGSTMKMADGSTMPMADMAPADSGTMEMADGSTMPMADMAPADTGTMKMADGSTMPMADMAMVTACTGESGLGFCDGGQAFDREIDISMSEWAFSDLGIEVQVGERIQFNVRNDGKVLHEFMFMAMAQMQAVNYRARRADWNLLEHEALFEQSLMLPGESISFVVEVQSTGSWMFMCMLPYHMQMGMMGQIATPGAAMEM
jgi:uncharacterized cupredoxin-like copper-binding protein